MLNGRVRKMSENEKATCEMTIEMFNHQAHKK